MALPSRAMAGRGRGRVKLRPLRPRSGGERGAVTLCARRSCGAGAPPPTLSRGRERIMEVASRHPVVPPATAAQPLAARMRPRTLHEFVGQEHILGPGRLLRRAIEADQLSSLIFYGPPGTGKTTLAMVVANTTRSHFITINAVLAGVADIRQAIADARQRFQAAQQRTIL